MLLYQVISWLLASNLFYMVQGHGYLIEPPSRNSAWRSGFDNVPTNHDDNELNCGGFSAQWEKYDGKCGVCGDEYDLEHPLFVSPGAYATGTITKTYTPGQQIQVEVVITSNHKGWFEFRLGRIGTPPITQAKLTHLLHLVSGGTRWSLDDPESKRYTIHLQLPAGLTCEHCVLQWWYSAGNNWGTDPETGNQGLGYGPQETFVNCADIAIEGPTAPTTTSPIQGTTLAPATTEPGPTTNTGPTTNGPTIGGATEDQACVQYKATGAWAGDEAMDNWCELNCSNGFCPASHCVCDTTAQA